MEDLWTPADGGPTCRLVDVDDHEGTRRELARLVPGWTAPPEHLWDLHRPEIRHGDGATLAVLFTVDRDLQPVRWRVVSTERGVVVVGDPALAGLLRDLVGHIGADGPEAMLGAVVMGLGKSVLTTLDEAADDRGPQQALGISRSDLRSQLRAERASLFLLQELFSAQAQELGELQDDVQRVERAVHAVRRARQFFQQGSGTASRLYALAGDLLTEESALVNERLTLVSTIFLPLTVTTGFFGMNFGWMVGRVGSLMAFVWLGIAVPAAVSAVTIAVVRRWGAGRS